MTNQILLYPDTGFLTFLAKKPDAAQLLSSKGFKFAYSEATLLDLGNAKHQNRELAFLTENKAHFLVADQDGLTAGYVEPTDAFARRNQLLPTLIGGLFSRLVGGGPDVDDDDFLKNLLGNIPDLPPNMIDHLIATYRGKASGVRKKEFNLAFDKSTRLTVDETLSEFIARHDTEAQEALFQLFPTNAPINCDSRAIASLMLNFFTEPAKGIRGEKAEPSEREVVDAFHISYGLGCEAFVTHDKATKKKYDLLAKYWNTKGHACLVERQFG